MSEPRKAPRPTDGQLDEVAQVLIDAAKRPEVAAALTAPKVEA